MKTYDYRQALTREIRKALEEDLASGRIRAFSEEEADREEVRLVGSVVTRGTDTPEACVPGNIGLLASVVRDKPSLLENGPEEIGTWILEGDFAAMDQTIRAGLFHECFTRAFTEIKQAHPLPKPDTVRILSGLVTFTDGRIPGADALSILNGCMGGSMLYAGAYRLMFWPGEFEGGIQGLLDALSKVTDYTKDGSVILETGGKRKALVFAGGTWLIFPVSDTPEERKEWNGKKRDRGTDDVRVSSGPGDGVGSSAGAGADAGGGNSGPDKG